MIRPLYKITTLEEDLAKLTRSVKTSREVVEGIISEMLASESEGQALEESAEREELAEDPEFDDEVSEGEDLDEIRKIRVRKLRGAERAKARRYRRKNKAKIRRYAKRYRRSAKGKRAIKRRKRIMKRMGLNKKKHPRRVRYQFQDSGVISNMAEEAVNLLRSLRGLGPDISEEVAAFAKLAKAADLLADRYASEELEAGQWDEESLRELAVLAAEVAEAAMAGKADDKAELEAAFEDALAAFTEALKFYKQALEISEMMGMEPDEMGMEPDDEEEPEGDEPEGDEEESEGNA